MYVRTAFCYTNTFKIKARIMYVLTDIWLASINTWND